MFTGTLIEPRGGRESSKPTLVLACLIAACLRSSTIAFGPEASCPLPQPEASRSIPAEMNRKKNLIRKVKNTKIIYAIPTTGNFFKVRS